MARNKKITKKTVTLILTAMLIISGISLPVTAESVAPSASNYQVEVSGWLDDSVKSAGADTYVVDFKVQTIGSKGIANAQSLKLSIDVEVLGIVQWNGEGIDLSALATTVMRLSNSTVSVLSGWTGNLWAALSTDGRRLLLLVEPSRAIDSFESPDGYLISDMTVLQSIRMAFLPGKSISDMSADTVRLMDVAEMKAAHQGEKLLLSDGSYCYTFGTRLDRAEAIALDILAEPEFNMGTGEKGNEAVPVTFLQIVDALGRPVAATVSVQRNKTMKYGYKTNEGAACNGIVWLTSNQALANVDGDGNVTILNRTGTVVLTVTDTVSGVGNSIVLRIT